MTSHVNFQMCWRLTFWHLSLQMNKRFMLAVKLHLSHLKSFPPRIVFLWVQRSAECFSTELHWSHGNMSSCFTLMVAFSSSIYWLLCQNELHRWKLPKTKSDLLWQNKIVVDIFDAKHFKALCRIQNACSKSICINKFGIGFCFGCSCLCHSNILKSIDLIVGE